MSGHSLGTDLLDEFGPSEDVKNALGILYLGSSLTPRHPLLSRFYAYVLIFVPSSSWC